MCRVLRIAAVIVGLLALAGAVYLARLMPRRPQVPAASSSRPIVAPRPTEPELDPQLLVTARNIEATAAADGPPYATMTLPLDTVYWDDKERWVMMEPSAPRKLADDEAPIIWHAWTADGGSILYATRDRVCIRGLPGGHSVTLLQSGPIDKVYLSPDQRHIAVASGRELSVVDIEGRSYGRHAFPLRVRSAAWHPGSSLIACSTTQTVWLVDLGDKPRAVKSYASMLDTWSEDVPKPRRVCAVDSLAWSASGRYLGYDVWVTVDEGQTKPYVTALDTKTGKDRLVQEGYSHEDRFFSWGPAEDWMALAGNMGEVDTYVCAKRAWGNDEYQLACQGTFASYQYTAWRPASLDLAAYWWAGYVDYLAGPVCRVTLGLLKDSNDYAGSVPKLKPQIEASLRRAKSPQVTPAESGIPDFDWSPDGGMYVFAERHYSVHQWAERKGDEPAGRWLGLLRIGSADTQQQVVVWSGQHPREPRFSPDGTRVSYISGGNIWVRNVTTEKRSVARVAYWRKEGDEKLTLGDLEGAVSALRNSVRHNPKDKLTHKLLALAYNRLAHIEKNPYRKYAFLSAERFEGEQAGEKDELLHAHLRAAGDAASDYQAKHGRR